MNHFDNSIIISAHRGLNILKLKEMILNIVEESYVEEKIKLGLVETKKAAAIHSLAEVLSTKYNKNSMQITYRTRKENSEKIKKIIYGQK